ncbi:MAG: transposase family protein [Mucilaginibacter sp.]|nr:transposase family protein [Mucilaginibacter sp.]
MAKIRLQFDKFHHALKDTLETVFPETGNILRPGPKPKFTDIDIIVLSLTSEYMGIDCEVDLFDQLDKEKKDFPYLISRRQYNDRRRLLLPETEKLCKLLMGKFAVSEDTFVIDSTPLRVCRIARWKRNKMKNENIPVIPNVGFCSAQEERYFGFKGHTITTSEGVLQSFELSEASLMDVKYLPMIPEIFNNSTIVGDKGYINDNVKYQLMDERKIDLQMPYRKNQKDKPTLPKHLRIIRKRIETTFSQLKRQFNMGVNLAKKFLGFKTRIVSKITSLTTIHFINKFITKRPTMRVKYALNHYKF